MAGYATDMIAKRDARIAQLEAFLESLANTCDLRAESPRICDSESGTLKYIALEIRKALRGLRPEDFE